MSSIKSQAEEIKKLLSQSLSMSNTVDNDINTELEPAPLFEVDFDKMHSNIKKQARRTIQKIIKHIIPLEILENCDKSAYIKEKMEVDTITFAGLLYQLRCNEIMEKTLMEEVGRGNPSPRLFETFTQISKNIADTNKQILLTEEELRKTYLSIKYEIRDRDNETVQLPAGGNSNLLGMGNSNNLSRGSKDIIKQIRINLNDEKIFK